MLAGCLRCPHPQCLHEPLKGPLSSLVTGAKQEQGDGSEGEVPRYSIVTNELWQSNLALGLGELVSSFAESMICFLCI